MKKLLEIKVNIVVSIGVIKRKNNPEWAAPTFIIHERNGKFCFISDFRELNKRIERKPIPIPKIQVLLLKL